MSESVYVKRDVKTFDTAPQFEGYTRVVITVADDVEYTSGTDTGRTLAMECPWGTQEMADKLLERLKGFKYQPYTATNAFLDPAAELGDGITVNGVYSGIYVQKTNFGGLCAADVSAPSEEEIDHEYPYVPQQERRVVRQLRELASELRIQAGLISAKVSATGGDASSFGWDLDHKSWSLKSKGSNVLYADENGVEITGKITATSGKIGGFDILADCLSYNGQTWMGTNTMGGYFGINGIQLGKNFRVDMAGNLYAASGEFSGTVKAGNIQYGGDNGTLPGGAITYGSVGTKVLSSAVNTSLGFADFSNAVFSGKKRAQYVLASHLDLAQQGYFHWGNKQLGTSTIEYVDHNGEKRSANVVVWRPVR